DHPRLTRRRSGVKTGRSGYGRCATTNDLVFALIPRASVQGTSRREGDSRKVSAMAATADAEWTCARCLMTASWMPGTEQTGMPAGWADHDGDLFCIVCRRERAAEAAMAVAPDGATNDDRRQLGLVGRIEFEMGRDPDRADTRIARQCQTSVAAVKKVRERLGAYPTRPS